jgi:hypothetical protein
MHDRRPGPVRRLRRLAFDEAGALSPLVVDVHRWWYLNHGRIWRRQPSIPA